MEVPLFGHSANSCPTAANKPSSTISLRLQSDITRHHDNWSHDGDSSVTLEYMRRELVSNPPESDRMIVVHAQELMAAGNEMS
ncbi:unnamed protein product [Somion occarium]|uniref:Uncharacterized protein n=1 Tax=Somion occarium TaxID=3059160 RepID=A0ABP1DIP7_9APHY